MEYVRIGTVGVVDASFRRLNQRLVARGDDDRIGAFVVLEALRWLKADRRPLSLRWQLARKRSPWPVRRPAHLVLNRRSPLRIDVTVATDHPDADKKQNGDVKLGKRAEVLSRGAAAANSPVVYEMLSELAEREQIPYSVDIAPRRTGTDADAIHLSRSGGVATAVVSIPNRYAHAQRNDRTHRRGKCREETHLLSFITSHTRNRFCAR